MKGVLSQLGNKVAGSAGDEIVNSIGETIADWFGGVVENLSAMISEGV